MEHVITHSAHTHVDEEDAFGTSINSVDDIIVVN